VKDRSVSFVPGGTKSLAGSMNSRHFNPINASSCTPLFQSIGSLIYNTTSLTLSEQCSVRDFFEVMECYQIADQLDPLLKPKDQSKTDKDKSNKPSEK
jgi:hypothetical protein